MFNYVPNDSLFIVPICFYSAALLAVTSARAQGTFQNLDFEQANIVPIVGSPYYPYAVSVADAMPGWTVNYGSVQQSVILYNDAALGGEPWLTLSANGYPGVPEEIIDGNFTPFLQAGQINGILTPVSISQSGEIPSGSQSILFDSTGTPAQMAIFIGNQQLSLFAVGTGTADGANCTIYGASVSAWAGQMEQLTFSALLGNQAVDDFSFSTQSVPEPSPIALTGVGALLFALYRRFAPNRP